MLARVMGMNGPANFLVQPSDSVKCILNSKNMNASHPHGGRKRWHGRRNAIKCIRNNCKEDKWKQILRRLKQRRKTNKHIQRSMTLRFLKKEHRTCDFVMGSKRRCEQKQSYRFFPSFCVASAEFVVLWLPQSLCLVV